MPLSGSSTIASYGSKRALFTKASGPISTNIFAFATLACEKRRGAEQFCPNTTRAVHPKASFRRLHIRQIPQPARSES
jgi:hypothetical protein